MPRRRRARRSSKRATSPIRRDELRARYFSPTPPFDRVAPEFGGSCASSAAICLASRAGRARFDLIVCRNVLIYFDRETQERLFETFHDALAPDGFLVLGKVETLLGPMRSRFAPVDARERIFRRTMNTRVRARFASRSPTTRSPRRQRSRRSASARASRSCCTTRRAHVGGLAHVLLPSETMSRDRSNPAKFPATAVPLLLERDARLGARRRARPRQDRRRREHVRQLDPAGGINIGERNVAAVRDVLADAKIPIVAEDIGSDYGRSVYFSPDDGRVEVRSLRKGSRVL